MPFPRKEDAPLVPNYYRKAYLNQESSSEEVQVLAAENDPIQGDDAANPKEQKEASHAVDVHEPPMRQAQANGLDRVDGLP